MHIVFWQLIVSPHMAAVASALAKMGMSVTYIAQRPMSEQRDKLGWAVPNIAPAELIIAPDSRSMREQLLLLSPSCVHICQGFRGNGPISSVQKELVARRLRHWIVAESIDDRGFVGFIKRIVYNWLCRRLRHKIEGVFAIGQQAPAWLEARGIPGDKIVPFCYFLEEESDGDVYESFGDRPVRIAYAGRLVPLKRVGDLINAAAALSSLGQNFELWIVGGGSDARSLKDLGRRRLGDKVKWYGQLPQGRVRELLGRVDCLVLPSEYDGWGAVVSESLMAGTPAISSEGCGAAVAIRRSGVGGVYPVGDIQALTCLLADIVASGPISATQRKKLIQWAKSLGANAGAKYLRDVLRRNNDSKVSISAPWER